MSFRTHGILRLIIASCWSVPLPCRVSTGIHQPTNLVNASVLVFPTFYRHMFALRIKALGSDTKERKGSQLRRLGLCILVINVQFLLIYNTESYKRISDHFSINS